MVKTLSTKLNNSILPKPPLTPYTPPPTNPERNKPNPGYLRSPRKPPPLTWRDYLPIDLDLDFYDNPCNKSIQGSLRIFGWRLPSFEILQRVEECRLIDSPVEPYFQDCKAPPKCQDEERAIYIWWLTAKIEYNDKIAFDREHVLFWELFSSESVIDKVSFPKDEFNKWGDPIYAIIEYTIIEIYKSNYNHNDGFQVAPRERVREHKKVKRMLRMEGVANLGAVVNGFAVASAGRAYIGYDYFANGEQFRFRTSWRKVGRRKSDALIHKQSVFNGTREGVAGSNATPYRNGESYPVSSYYDAFGIKVVKFETNLFSELVIDEQIYTGLSFCENGDIFVSECYPEKPKPPPPPKKMRCCPDNSALLKEILKIVKQNKKAIGYDDLPANLPKSFIVEDNADQGQEDKPNLVQIIGWLAERLDETMGQFELEIEIQDSDAVKEGDQPVTIKLPNIAESLGEITMMLLSILYDTDLSVNLNSKLLAEVGSSKQIAFKNNQAIDTIIDYLGYGIKQVREDLPMTFTPGAEEFSKLLEPKTIKVPVDELDDTRTLPTILQELLQAAAIIRAVHWRQVDPKKDVAKQILSDINYEDDYINKVSTDG